MSEPSDAGSPADPIGREPGARADREAGAGGDEKSDDDRGTPDLSRITDRLEGPTGVIAVVALVLGVVVLFYTLRVARDFFLPVVVAVLLNYLLSPVVRRLEDFGLRPPLGAAVVVLGFLVVTGTGFYHLSGPASDWLERAPETLRRAEYELRELARPVEQVQQAAEQVEEAAGGGEDQDDVQVDDSSVSQELLGGTWRLFAAGAIVLLLLYFLLASGDTFLRKLTAVLPRRRDRRRLVEITRSLESDLSTYLLTWVAINLGLGVVVAGALHLLEMPSPLLWGLVAAVLNFIPYVGPIVGISVVGLVALVSLDGTWNVLAPPLAYAVVNTIEGSFVTPVVMGRQLRLHPAVIFLGLLFWGWLWGIPGALLAVPLIAALKIFCDHVPVLRPVGEFLSR